ncbi:ElaB/YqjD/DUF883 family membrane-anchored ribosome-binding protein [Microbacterium laevaniformans]|nr:ElaB/YqjD/DUF883 family membrane-anchored ribosome-binding protein [Microbacterium laevaniformans]
MIRRFWARHPRLTDVIVALLTALVTFPAPGRDDFAGDARLWTGVRPIVVVVLTLACVAMLWRRRLPLVPFSLAAVGAVLAVSSGAGVGAATTAVAVYAVAVYAGPSAAWIASGIVVGGAAMAAGTAVLLGALPWSTAVNGCAALAVGLLLGCLVGVNIGNRARYVEALMETSGQLWAERSQHAEHAAAAERARIAREMHDVVAHSLTVMVALAEGATATEDAARARAATGPTRFVSSSPRRPAAHPAGFRPGTGRRGGHRRGGRGGRRRRCRRDVHSALTARRADGCSHAATRWCGGDGACRRRGAGDAGAGAHDV